MSTGYSERVAGARDGSIGRVRGKRVIARMNRTMGFTNRSAGFLALVSLAVGLAGVAATGCGLDVPSSIGEPEDTMDRDPPVETVVPISDIQLESPGR